MNDLEDLRSAVGRLDEEIASRQAELASKQNQRLDMLAALREAESGERARVTNMDEDRCSSKGSSVCDLTRTDGDDDDDDDDEDNNNDDDDEASSDESACTVDLCTVDLTSTDVAGSVPTEYIFGAPCNMMEQRSFIYPRPHECNMRDSM